MYKMNLERGAVAPPGFGPKERLRREGLVTKIVVGEADEPKEDRRKVHCIMNAGPGGAGEPYECCALVTLEAAGCILDALDKGAGDLRGGFGTPMYHLAHLGFCTRLAGRG